MKVTEILMAVCLPFLALGLFYLFFMPPNKPQVITEWIDPEIPVVHCLSWDEARDKYHISGEVLLEKMLEKCPT